MRIVILLELRWEYYTTGFDMRKPIVWEYVL